MSNTDDLLRSKNIDKNDILDKEVLGIDGLDLGKVIEIGDTFVVTQRGIIDKKKFHLPISSFDKFDGQHLTLKIGDSDLKNFEQTEDLLFKGYSSFKSSDMPGEVNASIPLLEEKLEVNKKIIKDTLKVIKEPIKESKREEVELTYDMVTIVKRPIQIRNNNNDPNPRLENQLSENNPNKLSNTIPNENEIGNNKSERVITLEREEPVITKRSFVREEVVIKKVPIVETKTISEQIIKEQLVFDENSDDRKDSS